MTKEQFQKEMGMVKLNECVFLDFSCLLKYYKPIISEANLIAAFKIDIALTSSGIGMNQEISPLSPISDLASKYEDAKRKLEESGFAFPLHDLAYTNEASEAANEFHKRLGYFRSFARMLNGVFGKKGGAE